MGQWDGSWFGQDTLLAQGWGGLVGWRAPLGASLRFSTEIRSLPGVQLSVLSMGPIDRLIQGIRMINWMYRRTLLWLFSRGRRSRHLEGDETHVPRHTELPSSFL